MRKFWMIAAGLMTLLAACAQKPEVIKTVYVPVMVEKPVVKPAPADAEPDLFADQGKAPS